MRAELIQQLAQYIPFNEQEERDRETILHLLRTSDNVFTRDNTLAHMTASAWVVNQARTKTVMAYHKIYNSWAWLGGHADGDEDLLAVALREVGEESGLKNVRPVSRDIFSVEVLTVDGHVKRGRYVASHLHLNVTYLLEADETDELTMKEDENSGVSWFTFADALAASNEPWFKERIYRKLMEKAETWSRRP